MSIKRKSFLCGGLVLSVFIILAVIARINTFAATSSATLTTAPISVNLDSTPGSTTSTKLQVQNNSSEPLTITVHLEEFKASGTGGQAQIYIPPANDPSLSWVHFSQTSFVAEPGVWNNVTMTVSLPKQAAQGYYYAVIFAPSTISTQSKNANVVKGANAIFVLVDSNNSKDNNQLSVSSFSVSSKSYNYLPVTFNINVKNTGNVFTVPSGDIYISRTPNGKSIDTLAINSGAGNVLPETHRVFNLNWDDGFPVYVTKTVDGTEVIGKNGKPIQQLQWNLNKITSFRFGKYYAKMVLVYNKGTIDVPVTGLVSFWVIPWPLIIAAVMSLVAIILVWEIFKRYIRKILRWKNFRGRNVK